MYAIVEIGGKQFKVEQSRYLYIPYLASQQVGAELEFDKVLLTQSEGKTRVGTPTIPKARIKAVVEEHVKSDKIVVFKKKRRKGYRVKKGHRQPFTRVRIDQILLG